MTNIPKIDSKDWRNLTLDKWNVSTFHAYLIDRNLEEYGATYLPFGQGPISKRWAQEKGQLKLACQKYGNNVIKLYIDKCFANHKYNPRFPVLSFGFMYSYMRNELAASEVESKFSADPDNEVLEILDEGWF